MLQGSKQLSIRVMAVLGDQANLSGITGFISTAIFLVVLLYGQKIQYAIILRGLGSSVKRLERMKEDARTRTIDDLTQESRDKEKVTVKVDRLLNFFVISPVSIDPKGLIPKLEHVIEGFDDSLKAEVKGLVPAVADARVSTLTNLVEVSLELNSLYRVARHFYLSGRKMGNLMAVIQAQVLFPFILEAAEAYHASLEAFSKGITIGDGLGPMVASKLAGDARTVELIKDTTVAETEMEGRRIHVVKAKGPGGNVGKPGEVIKNLVETHPETSLIVTVDAALKFEGEESGQVVEGIGAAIGGPGVERYKIEQVATDHSIPMIAVVVKMSQKEAITEIPQAVSKSVDEVISRVRTTVLERTKPGDTVIVAGIGNTLGIS